MDDADWSQSRYEEIQSKIKPFLRGQCGFKDEQVVWLPISGLNGDNIKERKGTPDWYQGPTLMDVFNKIEVSTHERHKKEAAFRIPMLDGYRDMGHLMGIGKVERGTIRPGDKMIIQPTGKTCTCVSVYIEGEGSAAEVDGQKNAGEVSHATIGESIVMKLNGVNEEDLRKGFVFCPLKDPTSRAVKKFKAQFKIIELVEGRPVLTAGYRCVVHFHTAIEDCEISKLLDTTLVTGKEKKKTQNPKFAKVDMILTCIITMDRPSALDSFSNCEKMGRFTLRDEGITVGIGKILELPALSAGAGSEKKENA